MVTTSPTSRYVLANSCSLRLIPRRFYKIRSEPSSTEIMLSRLFKLSLESLRGYMATREVSLNADLTTFANVVASQRYAQCRELATLLGYLDPSPDTLPRDVIRMKRIWTVAVDKLRQENVRQFLQAVVKAEQRLEDALLLAARQAETEAVKNCLHASAINICSVQDRLDEMLSNSVEE